MKQRIQQLRFSLHDRESMRHAYKLAAGKGRSWAWKIIRLMLVVGISFVIIYPLIVKFSVSIMSRSDMNDVAVRWVAKNPTLENFAFSFEAMVYPTALLNTVIVCVVCTVLQMFSCCLAAYAFVKLRFPGSRLVFLLAVFTLVVPPQTYMIAMYSQFLYFDPFGAITALTGKAGLINTFWPLFIRSFFGVGVRNGLYIYLMTQFFRNMPAELEEAAHVDGASPFKIFYKVMLPNAVPILVTIAVFSVVWQWNDEFYASLFAPRMEFISRNLYNINEKITVVSGAYVNDPAYTSILKNAASLLAVAPLLLVFVAAQKFFVENFERSGIVG
ncbi:MAG TPA: carbohydrate ABC transporter permease [Firmicutes bacterium]|nr:carbohydrate ABC transporter permease [Bacillota bacterium]